MNVAANLLLRVTGFVAISLENVGKGLERRAEDMTELGSMLFTRCVSGARYLSSLKSPALPQAGKCTQDQPPITNFTPAGQITGNTSSQTFSLELTSFLIQTFFSFCVSL